ncbi:tetratricopeptide repeat-containing sensor histidine kinase [Winogradskyella rapida]|uniref:histidine kinase n=1 Tax=Winogradskyella rapida TaxID=549701 RepID=A0ABW3KNM7_9FLAO
MQTLHFAYGQIKTDSLKYYSQIALNPQSPNDLDKAFQFYTAHYSKAQKENSKFLILNDLYYLSSLNYKKGAYEASENHALEAIKILDNSSESPYYTQLRKSVYTLLGILYYEQRNNAKALELYDRVLEITTNARDSAIVYNNISNIYKRDEDYENAKTQLLKAYAIIPRIKDKLSIARIKDNLGFIYSLLNNREKDLPLMTSALDLRDMARDTLSLYTSHSHLAHYFYDVDRLDKASHHALKAQEFATHINSPIYIHDALGMLTMLSSDTYAKTYKKLNDSLTNADKERASRDAFMKYDNAEFKRKALESQLKEEQQRTRSIIASIVAASIALIAILIYFILKSKHKKEKLQQVYDAESRISKQIHDEVANDVFQFMTKLESEALSNEHLIDELQDIYSKTRDISKEYSFIEGEGIFADTIKDLVLSFSDTSVRVLDKGRSDIAWETFSKMKRTTVYKVLQELLINMKKHSQASIAVLTFTKEGKKTIITYSDNGVGSDLNKSNGLQNVENRIESLNGTITFETEPNKGFKTKIVI